MPMTGTMIAEWGSELTRRLFRARALVYLGLPDPGFQFLTFEIYRFRAALRAMKERRHA